MLKLCNPNGWKCYMQIKSLIFGLVVDKNPPEPYRGQILVFKTYELLFTKNVWKAKKVITPCTKCFSRSEHAGLLLIDQDLNVFCLEAHPAGREETQSIPAGRTAASGQRRMAKHHWFGRRVEQG